MVNGHSASWATQKWSSAGAALEPSPDSLPTLGDRRGIDALSGAKPAASAGAPLDVPPHFVPFGMIEDPYADELAQRSAEFARHAAFDDPTPPQGLPVWNPSPPLVPAEQAAPEPEVIGEADPPLAAQLSLGQRFELAFAELERDTDEAADADVYGAAGPAGADDAGEAADLIDTTLEIHREPESRADDEGLGDQAPGSGPRVEPLPPAALPPRTDQPTTLAAAPTVDMSGQFQPLVHPVVVPDPAAPADAMEAVEFLDPPWETSVRPRLAAVPDPQPPEAQVQAHDEAHGEARPGPVGEQQGQPHLGAVADPQGVPHVRPMADSRGKPHLGPVADAHGGARLGPVPEPWAPAFAGPTTDPRGGPRAGFGADPLGRRRLAPVADPVAEPQKAPQQGPQQGPQQQPQEDQGLGSVPGDELPQRVPSHPDVPATVEPADDAHQPAAPQLSRMLEGLRQVDAPPAERPVGFDTEAVLAAVRSVAGVRQATIRTTVTGGHHLRLELAEGADPSTISRMVARMLQEQMGLDAALTGPPPGRHDEPGPGGPGLPGNGPQARRIPGRHDPSGPPDQPPLTLPGPRVGAGATPSSTFDDVSSTREPRKRHPVSVPRRQPSDTRPPAEFTSPTDYRSPTDFRPPGASRQTSDPRSSGESPADIRFGGDPRALGEPRSPADVRFGADVRQPERTPSPWRSGTETEHPAPGVPPAVPTDRDQGPRAVIEHVQTSTYGLDATVEVRLTTDRHQARGFASGPAVDAYVLRLCAAATVNAIDELLKSGTTTGEAGRCFVEHAAIVPMGGCDVAVVVVLLVCGGWVEQLAGSALVSGDPRRAVVRATLGAVNRRLAALLI